MPLTQDGLLRYLVNEMSFFPHDNPVWLALWFQVKAEGGAPLALLWRSSTTPLFRPELGDLGAIR
jgi:hypothetical protein